VNTLLAERGLGSRPIALITPGTVWETKHWLSSNFAEVGRHFLQTGWDVVLAGAPRDRKACAAVAAECPAAIDLCGQTLLSELAALIRRVGICITNDSGPMHLAAALGYAARRGFRPDGAGLGRPLWKPACGCAGGFALFAMLSSKTARVPVRSCLYATGLGGNGD